MKLDAGVATRDEIKRLWQARARDIFDDVSGEPNTARLVGHMCGLFCKFAIEQQERRQGVEQRLAKVEAALEALQSMPKPKLLAVGGDDKARPLT